MKNTIEVSIIMPVYNSERYLEQCVNSILNQDFFSFELLLIDDGSSDRSSEICDELAERDKRIKVFHKENGGICEARNFGLKHAKGTYIAFSDHDDAVKAGFLGINYKYAMETGADVVKFGREAIIINDNKIIKKDTRQFQRRCLNSELIRNNFLELRFKGAMTCVWDGLFKKSFLMEKNIQFNTKYKKGGEDIDFCSRCFAEATKIAFNEGVYYEHYIRIGYSTSTKPDDMRLIKFKMLIDNLLECINSLNIKKEGNSLLYLCVIKELVYPSLVYFKSIKASYADIKNYLENERVRYEKYSVHAVNLVMVDLKWGVFASLFKYGMYKSMYRLLKFKK